MSPSAVKTLYFDESGYTGSNLLDANQPTFVIASTDLKPSDAEKILRKSFPRYQGCEYKFSSMWRSKARQGLLDFSHEIHDKQHHVFLWMIDKRFAVLTKIVDFLVEPWLTESGHDFYADGYCWKFTNFVYFALQQFSPFGTYEDLLEKYQSFSRNPSTEGLHRLQFYLRSLADNSDGIIQSVFEQMSCGADLFTRYHDIDSFPRSNDLHLSSMFAVISYWRKHYSEDFIVFHDDSANFFRQQRLWARLTDAGVDRLRFPLGDGTAVDFPLRVRSTEALDSRCNRTIQFCDILAGVIAKHFDPRLSAENRQFLDEVIGAGLGRFKFNGIRPEPTFPNSMIPRLLAGPDSVDILSGILAE